MKRERMADHESGGLVRLPGAKFVGEMRFEQVARLRRSLREYGAGALTLAEVAQLLWATQGMTGVAGLRTVPSAGELYPLECYLVAGQVEGLATGLYRYEPRAHGLQPMAEGDLRVELAQAALEQEWVREGAALLVLSAEFERTRTVYGDRGTRYVWMEVGAAIQNAQLQAASLGLGSVVVGAFDDAAVKERLQLPAAESVVAMVPLGRLP